MTITLTPELLVAIGEYIRLRQIPADKFPGHRAACMSNLVGAIGEAVVVLYQHKSIEEPSNISELSGTFLTDGESI